MHQEYVILDFETNGLSTEYHRIIEIGAVLVKGDKLLKKFHTLINPGMYVSSFITSYTGITNEMLQGKPSPEEVMMDFKDFIQDRPILAHNSSFDKKFLIAEMDRINFQLKNHFLCTLLLSRRLIPLCPSYKLSSVIDFLEIDRSQFQSHRALDDVYMTAKLWFYLHEVVRKKTADSNVEIGLFQKLMKTPLRRVEKFWEQILDN